MNISLTSRAAEALETATEAVPFSLLPTAAWDLKSFLENGAEYLKTVGGALLVVMGVAAVIWGAVLVIKKLMSGQQNQDNWVKIIMLLIVGGAIAVGGFALVFEIGSGGKKTIEDLGGGTILWDSLQPLGMFLGLA